MPGTFTHWMVVEQALDRRRRKKGNADPLVIVLEKQFSFALQGAVGPDYPFLAERLPVGAATGDWGARMHFENTGALVQCGLQNLHARQGADFEICEAWLLGFASHLVADTIIHPVVNLAVGGIAQFTEEDHGVCEMTQDCWLFAHLKNHEIADCGYVDHLPRCSDPGNRERIHPTIRSFWTENLKAAHPSAPKGILDAIDPDKWHKELVKLVPWAANPTPFSRHIGRLAGAEHRLYKRSRDLRPVDVANYVTRLRLPDGAGGSREGSLLEALNAVVDEVVAVWEQLLANLSSPVMQATSLIRNWDLDTGVEVPSWDFDSTPDLSRLALWDNQTESMA